MRDLVLRQQASQGGTYSLHNHQGTTSISQGFDSEVNQATDRQQQISEHEAGLRARVDETMRQRRQRRNQTSSSHRGTLQQENVADRMINRRPQSFPMTDDEEEMFEPEEF